MKYPKLPSALVVTLLFSATATLAEIREPIFRENKKPSCNRAAFGACEGSCRASASASRSRTIALEPLFQALSGEIASLEKSRRTIIAEIASLNAEINSLSAESEFLKAPAPAPGTGPLPGFPTLEDFFTLHPIERTWHDRYSGERLNKLSIRLREAGSEESDLNERLVQFTGEFEHLNKSNQAILSQKNAIHAQANQHESRCLNECESSFCPSHI